MKKVETFGEFTLTSNDKELFTLKLNDAEGSESIMMTKEQLEVLTNYLTTREK